ncbi:erythromycin esterase-like protein [Chitinophaga dinghuensis]|uniref:Erythromycin esterase-like protein n=1 Tax=Chitinophaga dinghuensis TaxID=1539050 RepID=A0A327VYA5_9BACT|nr:erythromycin esterase family protein [Chitinophaga dinghuensis]RAJ76742.1 erythromycin esterase-like protein [Chitinophaga dinghuensis]
MLKKWLTFLYCLCSTTIFAQQATAPVFSLAAAHPTDTVPENLYFAGPYASSYHAVYDKQLAQTLRITITDSVPRSPGLMILQKLPLPVSAGGKLFLRIQARGKHMQQVQLSCAIMNKTETIVGRLSAVSSFANGWQTFIIQGNIPSDAVYIAPILQIDGPGEWRLSSMTATMNGKPLHQWLDQQYIATATASRLSLQPFTPAAFGDTMLSGHIPRILAIGEYCHGAASNIHAYTNIAQQVLTKGAYNAVTLEIGVDVALHIDKYVNGDSSENIAALLKLCGWHMNNQEILDFLQWIRNYNATHPSPIHVMGMDMQLPFLAISELAGDSSLGPAMVAAVTNIGEIAEEMLSGMKVDTATLHTAQYHFQQLVATAHTDKATLLKMHQVAQFLELCSRQGKPDFNGRHIFEQGGFRDSCMAVNLRNALQDTSIRAVLIAHNAHLMKLQGMAGGYLQQYFGSDYVMVMSLIGAGNYFYAWNYATQQALTAALPAIPIGSLEYNITKNNHEPGWLSLHSPEFEKRYRHNILGVHQNKAVNYSWNIVPAEQADYMIYLPQTTPAATLH